jgi:hypothetical protein
MKKLILLFIFLAGDLAAQDFHAVLKTSRTYMDHTRDYQTEYWFCKDKSCIKRGRQTTIVRHDLGLVWTIFGKNYYEKRLNSEDQNQKPEKEEFNVSTFGFERYTPDYDWIVKKSDQTKMINGFLCEQYLSDGDADFAETQSEFWICQKSTINGSNLFNKILQEEFKNDKARQQIGQVLKKNKNSFPVKMYETVVNSIAPNMIYDIQLATFEETKIEKEIYELPQGLEKKN